MKASEIEKINVSKIITPELRTLDKVFRKYKHEIRIVGGAVRDIALKKTPEDIDLGTTATPDDMIKMFDKENIRYEPTGLQHGTLTAIINKEPFEITTLRSDDETDGRRAKVSFVKDWEIDAERRDLTYNAMSLDFQGNLYDYFGGLDDLQDKVSKFVGDPNERIKEDYLRILRYFRFQSKLVNPSWLPETITAIKNNKDGLKSISVERIWKEVKKILMSVGRKETLEQMQNTGVAGVIGLDLSNAKNFKGRTAISVLARVGNNIKLADTWKLSNYDSMLLKFYSTYNKKQTTEQEAKEMIVDGAKPENVAELLHLQGQDGLANKIEKWQVPEYPITGKDLIDAGMQPGIEMGNKLRDLKQKWKESGYTLDKQSLLKL